MPKIQKGEYLEILLRSPKTVFTLNDIVLIWGEPSSNKLNVRLKSYVDTGKLFKITKGIYAKDKNYDKYELAIKLSPPAYISFETVLRSVGVTFQYYSTIFVASKISINKKVDGQKYQLKRIKPNIFNNTIGIKKEGNVFVASTERALLDTIYLNKTYYFDNLRSVDWKMIDKILPIYNDNKRMARQIKNFRKIEY
jgi:predicted transcriptional regulator of viral defense system